MANCARHGSPRRTHRCRQVPRRRGREGLAATTLRNRRSRAPGLWGERTMKRFVQFMLCLALVTGLAAPLCRASWALQGAPRQSAAETFEGPLDLPGRPIIVTLRLQTAESATIGT